MSCDILIQGGADYDGTGAQGIHADVAISQGRLTAIGPSLGL